MESVPQGCSGGAVVTDPWHDVVAGRSRPNGPYAAHKLTFFDRYLPPAFKATKKKRTRHYLDLFAGPGVWNTPDGARHLGSPLKVLELCTQLPFGEAFTELYFVNRAGEDHEALNARVDMMVERGLTNLPREAIRTIHADANRTISDILQRIHTKSWILAYADIENPRQWPWTTVEALRAGGHSSLDLYVLLPLQMALQRVLGFTQSHPEAVTRFYGTDEWKKALANRKTSAHSRAFRREMEDLYSKRLEALGWKYVNRQRRVADVGLRYLYYMLFATNHPVAWGLSEWEAVPGGDERYRGQGELFT